MGYARGAESVQNVGVTPRRVRPSMAPKISACQRNSQVLDTLGRFPQLVEALQSAAPHFRFREYEKTKRPEITTRHSTEI